MSQAKELPGERFLKVTFELFDASKINEFVNGFEAFINGQPLVLNKVDEAKKMMQEAINETERTLHVAQKLQTTIDQRKTLPSLTLWNYIQVSLL